MLKTIEEGLLLLASLVVIHLILATARAWFIEDRFYVKIFWLPFALSAFVTGTATFLLFFFARAPESYFLETGVKSVLVVSSCLLLLYRFRTDYLKSFHEMSGALGLGILMGFACGWSFALYFARPSNYFYEDYLFSGFVLVAVAFFVGLAVVSPWRRWGLEVLAFMYYGNNRMFKPLFSIPFERNLKDEYYNSIRAPYVFPVLVAIVGIPSLLFSRFQVDNESASWWLAAVGSVSFGICLTLFTLDAIVLLRGKWRESDQSLWSKPKAIVEFILAVLAALVLSCFLLNVPMLPGFVIRHEQIDLLSFRFHWPMLLGAVLGAYIFLVISSNQKAAGDVMEYGSCPKCGGRLKGSFSWGWGSLVHVAGSDYTQSMEASEKISCRKCGYKTVKRYG